MTKVSDAIVCTLTETDRASAVARLRGRRFVLQQLGQRKPARFCQSTLADLSHPADLRYQRNIEFSSGMLLNFSNSHARRQFKQLEAVWCDFKYAHIGDDHIDHANTR